MISILLPDIRSVHNVGSIFRTADCAGVGKIFLAGCTPLPIDRFNRPRKDFSKVSLGAEKSISWEQVGDIKKTITFLSKIKKTGWKLVAFEQSKNSENYENFRTLRKSDKNILIILGNEVDGVPENILKMCDHIYEIPMKGEKESLNVSVVAGIALF